MTAALTLPAPLARGWPPMKEPERRSWFASGGLAGGVTRADVVGGARGAALARREALNETVPSLPVSSASRGRRDVCLAGRRARAHVVPAMKQPERRRGRSSEEQEQPKQSGAVRIASLCSP